MSLKTAKQYVDSLRMLKLDLYLLGEKVENWVDHPIIRPSINSVAMTYKLAQTPDTQGLALAESMLTGEKINRFNSLFQSTDELVLKIKLQREMGRRTGACFQRCVGMDAANAEFSTTFEIDKKCGTDYHRRFCEWFKRIQAEDLVVNGAMTDVKGDRGLSPSEQKDPDMFVRIVEKTGKGIVVRGAKASQTGAANSHEVLLMPTLRLRPGEEQYAVCAATPVDAKGIHIIYGRQPSDTRKLEHGEIDVGNFCFGGQETLTVFEDVFTPHERVFMAGEVDFSSMLVERFASYHRQSYGGCKSGIGDVLVGAAASMADYNGVSKASHIKDKLAEMVHLVETIYSCGLACSHEGEKTAAGNFQCNTLLANVCKLNVTRLPYELCRLAEDIAGGLLVTMPSEKDLKSPAVGKFVEKYLRGKAEVPTEARMRMLSLIHSMTMGATAPSYRTESMHGAGSPQAQKIMIERQADMEQKKKLARKIAGIDPREDVLS
jgi:4-hydroxybutyryl-CoA dehydratase / vinylacetyl-CoA-Delta-isomerase